MIKAHRNALLLSLANTITDYHQNEIAPITPTHVERWLNQFEIDDQPIILAEMESIMKRFYFSKFSVKACLRNFLRNDVVATHDPANLLPHISFLRVQNNAAFLIGDKL